jgi:ElaB/YqjD/DUF883 family membrane-anchored ribosome-binding protein
LDQYLAAAGKETEAYPVLLFVGSLVTGHPSVWVGKSISLTPRPLGSAQNEVVSRISKIQLFESPAQAVLAAYWLWCARELGEALTLLETEHGDQTPPDDLSPPDDWYLIEHATLLAGVRLDLATVLEAEIAEQLLSETENRLEELIEFLQEWGEKRKEDANSLGRLYLRLAQVRQRLGKTSRAGSAAARLAHQYAEGAQDKEALTLLARLFPAPRRSAARK